MTPNEMRGHFPSELRLSSPAKKSDLSALHRNSSERNLDDVHSRLFRDAIIK